MDDEYVDIDGTIEALREAWRLVPEMQLWELLDNVTPMSFVEMSNSDLIESLNEFILQNQ